MILPILTVIFLQPYQPGPLRSHAHRQVISSCYSVRKTLYKFTCM